MAFNWTEVLIQKINPEFENLLNAHPHEAEALVAAVTLSLTALLAVVLALLAKKQFGGGQFSVTPTSKFSIRGIIEIFTEATMGLTEMVIGENGKRYTSFFAAVFFFVLLNNLIGLIPGMTPATENLNTTLGFGVFMFLSYNYLGIRENGILAYIKHFMGPVIVLAPFMFAMELISHIVRPLSLGLRLSNVLMGDHAVLSVFLDLAPAFVPIPFYVMGLFICFVQAFVFTLLSMVYVALATAGEHEH